jgi:phosphate starvation-inducible membrane PsiE
MRGENMYILQIILIVFITLGLIPVLIISILSKSTSGLKIMLLGINLTLLGGVIAVDQNRNYGAIVYFIALLGLIISLIGVMKNN